MKNVKTIEVEGQVLSVLFESNNVYVSLSDMAKHFNDSTKAIPNWLRNGKTVSYLTSWERFNNPNFNFLGLEMFKTVDSSGSLVISVKSWVKETNAIGIYAKSGKYDSGTWAHEDIALQFAQSLSSDFYLMCNIKLKQLLKAEAELEKANYLDAEWLLRRSMTKVNWVEQTDAVKVHLQPLLVGSYNYDSIYGIEANHLNVAVFGMKHAEWVKLNPELAKGNKNQRDYASVPQLLTLSSIESINAKLIELKVEESIRIKEINKTAAYLIDLYTKNKSLQNK